MNFKIYVPARHAKLVFWSKLEEKQDLLEGRIIFGRSDIQILEVQRGNLTLLFTTPRDT